MQVSLRKANALQTSINEVLKGLEFNSTVSINEFQNPEKEIESAHDKFNKNVSRRFNLISALYDIRNNVSVANAQNNIDQLLADLARTEKEIVFFSQYVKATPQIDIEIIRGKMTKIATRSEESYYTKAEVETSIFTESDLEYFRANLSNAKKGKQAFQDKLLELNVKTTITLTESTVEILKSEDIL